MSTEVTAVDVAIIGGGPAGLTAALYLGRGRKSVAVLDAGSPRHAASAAMHNFLTRDGMPPGELRRVAWEQMAAYPTVRHVAGARVESLRWEDERWIAGAGDAGTWSARAVLLATGMVDQHPDIPGYRERWGHAIHHCPYCHGWELRDQPLAVLATGEGAAHMAPLLRGWTDDVVVLTHGEPLDDEVRRQLAAVEIEACDKRIAALEGPAPELASIGFEDGTSVARRGLFVVAPQRQVPLVESLDLALSDQGYVTVDMMMRTSRPMLWAAGDLTSRMQQVVVAAAQGSTAGATINAALTLPGGLPAS